MAGIALSSSSKSGRRPVDANLGMVPMIDLLVSCIAFLLATAVWVQTGALQSRQPKGTDGGPEPPAEHVLITIGTDAVRVGRTEADAQTIPAGPRQLEALQAALHAQRASGRIVQEVWIQPESAVGFDPVAKVMGTVQDAWGPAQPGSARQTRVPIRLL
jgi:biopolymer transport protein ExbD